MIKPSAELVLTSPDGTTGSVSDGYHTFDELYDHRCVLFLALMSAWPTLAWFSSVHADGSTWDGWFIAGLNLQSPITYHLPNKYLSQARESGATWLTQAPEWDGHTSADVLNRLLAWLRVNAISNAPLEKEIQ